MADNYECNELNSWHLISEIHVLNLSVILYTYWTCENIGHSHNSIIEDTLIGSKFKCLPWDCSDFHRKSRWLMYCISIIIDLVYRWNHCDISQSSTLQLNPSHMQYRVDTWSKYWKAWHRPFNHWRFVKLMRNRVLQYFLFKVYLSQNMTTRYKVLPEEDYNSRRMSSLTKISLNKILDIFYK